VGAPASIGFFGKLPCNGDFLQRRMPDGFLDVWDPWLQESIHASRQALQERWLNIYLTSPIWRFVLTSSACGSGAYAGVLAPSVDRVGRYFPLTVVTQIDADESPLDFATRCDAWFASIEGVVVHALEDPQLGVDWFDAEIGALAAQLPASAAVDTRVLQTLFAGSSFPGPGAWRVPIVSAAELQISINSFAFRELHAQLRPVTLWWTDGSAVSAPSWLTLRGLPLPAHFAALLDGQWARDGWQNLGDLEMPSSAAVSTAVPTLAEPETALPAAMRRATFPSGQLTAIETNHSTFIDRSDLGLWAVATALAPGQDPTALRMVSDVLHQMSPASSLTALVEAVRHALIEVNDELRRLASRDVQRIESVAHLAVLVVAGAEAALLSAGETQRLRLRGHGLEWLSSDVADPAGSEDSGSLLDLFESVPPAGEPLGAPGFRDVELHYEASLAGDRWILCAGSLLAPTDMPQLTALASSGMPISVSVIVDSLSRLGAPDRGMPPMITVEL
jgi:type VI secretion system protein ImpM